MRKTSIKSSTVVPHPLYQFPAFPDRRTGNHSTWTDRCSVTQSSRSLGYDNLEKYLPPPLESADKNRGEYIGRKIEKKKCSCNKTTHHGMCIRDTTRGYVLVPARKFEELNRIEALLESEKAVLRDKCVQAIASDNTEVSARVPTENVWLGVEEVCHREMAFASQHFNSLNDKIREEHSTCKTRLEQRDNVVNRNKHNTTAILRANEVALLPLGNRVVRWKAMLARDATAAQERERCLMGFEDALQACLDKYREAEDRLHDYALYYGLAISFRALSEDNFRHAHRPGEILKLQLYHSSEIIQRMWRRRCVGDLLLNARKSAVVDYIQQRRGEDLAALATAEIERISELQRLVDNAESNAQTSFLEQFQNTKKRRSVRFFTWLLRKSDDYYMPAHAREIIAKEMNNVKTEQMHLSMKNRDMHLLNSKSQMLHEAKNRLMYKAIHIARIQTIHDFNAKRPPRYTCCDPNCKRTFAAEDTYRAHWLRDPHADGGAPSGIVDIHLLLIDPKGRHTAQCFLAMWGGGESLNSISFWEGVELWRKHLSTSPEFEMAAKMLYRRFLAPGALSRALQTCGGDMTSKNKDEDQFLDVGSNISPEYLDTQQWGTLCAIKKALGQEFWVSEIYRHYKEQAHEVKMAEEKNISERLNIERHETLRKFARNFQISILEKKNKRKEIVAERLTEKVVVLACENILVSALEGAAAVVEMGKEGERKRKALCEVMAEACVWKCAGLVADSCISWWMYDVQDHIEEEQQRAIYKEDEDVCWYNDELYYDNTQRV